MEMTNTPRVLFPRQSGVFLLSDSFACWPLLIIWPDSELLRCCTWISAHRRRVDEDSVPCREARGDRFEMVLSMLNFRLKDVSHNGLLDPKARSTLSALKMAVLITIVRIL
jgi:hypothetical protein